MILTLSLLSALIYLPFSLCSCKNRARIYLNIKQHSIISVFHVLTLPPLLPNINKFTLMDYKVHLNDDRCLWYLNSRPLFTNLKSLTQASFIPQLDTALFKMVDHQKLVLMASLKFF